MTVVLRDTAPASSSKTSDMFDFHFGSVSDASRTEGYQAALRKALQSGCVLLEIGTGTGVLTVSACRAGARIVYTAEVGKIIELANLVCTKNGVRDRVVFLNQPSYDVDLPEKVDVLLVDLAFDAGLISAVIDARDRHLKPDGVVIPESVDLYVVPIALPRVYEKIGFWSSEQFGVDLSPIRSFAANNYYRARLTEDAFLSEPALATCLSLGGMKSPFFSFETEVIATQDGLLDGIGVCVDVHLCQGISLSTHPSNANVRWSHLYFPLIDPIVVSKGEVIRIAMQSHDGDHWRWQVASVAGFKESRIHQDGVSQTTFLGFPLSLDRMRGQPASTKPRLSPKGEAELLLLSLVDGARTIADLEQAMYRRCPHLFKTTDQAAQFVRTVARPLILA
jgi:protein arginine N-methyltransferase 1